MVTRRGKQQAANRAKRLEYLCQGNGTLIKKSEINFTNSEQDPD